MSDQMPERVQLDYEWHGRPIIVPVDSGGVEYVRADLAAAAEAERAALRAEVERLREAGVDLANQLESVTLIGEDAELRPDAMSYQKPSEFKAYAVYALRTLAAQETPDA